MLYNSVPWLSSTLTTDAQLAHTKQEFTNTVKWSSSVAENKNYGHPGEISKSKVVFYGIALAHVTKINYFPGI